MFTRRGDARAARTIAEPQLTEHQLQEARAAAAAPVQLAALQDPSQLVAPHHAAAPPPVPGGPVLIAAQGLSSANNHSVIGEDLTIEGQSITIRCKGALEINGKIQAELHSQKLVVGKSGQVEGTIAADSVDVMGRVSGTIMGARVVLHPTAEVEGDIHAKTLSVSDGATFEGRSRRVTDEASIAPRLDPTAPLPAAAVAVPVPKPVSAVIHSVHN